MTEKDYHLYGTKVLNLKTQEIGLLICTWKNRFADAEIDCLGFLPRSESFAYEPSVQVSSISSLSEFRYAQYVRKSAELAKAILTTINSAIKKSHTRWLLLMAGLTLPGSNF